VLLAWAFVRLARHSLLHFGPDWLQSRGMRFVLVIGLGLWAMAMVPGCKRPVPADTARAPAKETVPSQPLPKLPTIKVWVGDQELITEVAGTSAELKTGMMYRTNVAENEAMLFVFGQPWRAAFYMKNTRVPLSCAYIDPRGAILELHDLKPMDETAIESATDRVQYVLETSQGWFNRHQVNVGAAVRTQYGPLSEIDWATLRPKRAR
jgi:uncharacterized membrane protein (UPF0127 family)